jgi:hypothetical protein
MTGNCVLEVVDGQGGHSNHGAAPFLLISVLAAELVYVFPILLFPALLFPPYLSLVHDWIARIAQGPMMAAQTKSDTTTT